MPRLCRRRNSIETFLQKAREYQQSSLRQYRAGLIGHRNPNDDASRLVALPAELRTEVWKSVMAVDWGADIDLYQGYAELCQRRPIVDVCTQMRDEAKELLQQLEDKFFRDTRLILNILQTTNSSKYLKEEFKRLKTLNDDDVVKIKRLKLSSPSTREVLPVCEFSNGSWYCFWLPPPPFVPHSCRIIQYNISHKEMSRAIPHDMPFEVIDGYETFWSFGFNNHFRAVALDSRATREQVEAAVAATGYDRLTKEEIKFMLAWQWANRTFP